MGESAPGSCICPPTQSPATATTAWPLASLAHDVALNAEVRRASATASAQLGRVAEASEVLLALAQDEALDDMVRYRAYYSLKQLHGAQRGVGDFD